MDQRNKSRARVRLAVISAISLNSVALVVLLMLGCRKPAEPAPDQAQENTNGSLTTPQMDTNPPVVAETNPPSTNPMVAPAPAPAPMPPPPPAPPAGQEYTIIKGDTFATLHKKFGVSVKAIQEANPGVDPRRLKIGQKLQIPASNAAPAAEAPGAAPMASAAGTGGGEVYTVKSGDNLTIIAGKFHTSVKAIRSANKLTTDRITVGQKLKIPTKAAAPEPAPAPAPAPTMPEPAPAPAPAPVPGTANPHV